MTKQLILFECNNQLQRGLFSPMNLKVGENPLAHKPSMVVN